MKFWYRSSLIIAVCVIFARFFWKRSVWNRQKRYADSYFNWQDRYSWKHCWSCYWEQWIRLCWVIIRMIRLRQWEWWINYWIWYFWCSVSLRLGLPCYVPSTWGLCNKQTCDRWLGYLWFSILWSGWPRVLACIFGPRLCWRWWIWPRNWLARG